MIRDELEETIVGPVEVLEDEHEGSTRRDRLKEAPPGRKRLGAVIGAEIPGKRESGQRREMSFDPAGFASIGKDVVDG